MLALIAIFLLYVGMTLAMRVFISSVAASRFLSMESRIFFNAFLPIVLFFSFFLLVNPEQGTGGLIFMLALTVGRVIVLIVDGNQYLYSLEVQEDVVEIVFRTDFLQLKAWVIPLHAIRSIKLDDASGLTGFPCRFQLILKNGNKARLLIIDREQLQRQEESIIALVRKLKFTEK
jgi:hypothetical protein